MTIQPTRLLRLTGGIGVLAVLLAVGGCDLFGSNDLLYSGVVTERGTGLPIENIHVSFQRVGSVGNTSIVTETLTDSAGRFSLRYSGGALFINDPPCYGAETCPFNPAYSGGVFTLGNGDRTQVRIELDRRTTP